MNIIKNLKKINKKIVIIGDTFLDKYVEGESNRLSPEVAVPVLNPIKIKYFLGGAANVAANFSRILFKPVLISRYANDKNKKFIKKLLKENKINFYNLYDKKFSNIVKTRFLSGNQQILRLDEEKKLELNNGQKKKLLNFLKKEAQTIGTVLLSDYDKGFFNKDLIQKIIKICKKNKIRVVCAPKNTDPGFYKYVDILCPNEKEFNSFYSNFSFKNKISLLFKKCKIKNLIITKGSKGALLYNKMIKRGKIFPTRKVDIYDVAGAGDTFIAALVASLETKRTLEDSIEISNIFASDVVTKKYVSLPNEEIITKYFRYNKNSYFNIIKQWKQSGLTIGFTNGCFDILHAGHVRYLDRCKRLCDKLIVMVNADSSVKLIKGENRPINTLKNRLRVLNSLKSVDICIPFNEKDPLKHIKIIKPDFLFKGGDYKYKKLIGKNYMRKIGGKVILMPFYNGLSSSKILASLEKK